MTYYKLLDLLKPVVFTLSTPVLILLSVACTEPNPSFEACQKTPWACTDKELCDGIDGDGDGQIDEDLEQPCALFYSSFIGGPEGRFGRSIAVFDDVDGDGYEEVYISASPAPHKEGDLPPVDPQGSIFLMNGADFSTIYKVSRRGTFGAQVAVGDFDGDGEREVASSTPFGGIDGEVGVWIYERNGELNARYLAEDEQGRFGASMSITTPISEDAQGDALLVSEPYTTTEGGSRSGRLVSLRIQQGRVVVDHTLNGTADEQRLGERVLSVFDKDGDEQPEILSTVWRSSEDGAEREVWLLNKATGARALRIAEREDTQGSFGEGLAWGHFHSDGRPNLVLGAPLIASDEGPDKGRAYFVDEDGVTLGISGVEDKEYGSALLTIKRSEEEGDVLLVAGRGYLRILGKNRQVVREINLEYDEIPSLATSSNPDPDGRIRVYVGFPEAGRVYVLGVR